MFDKYQLNTDTIYQQAKQYLLNRDYEQAIVKFSELLRIKPEHSEALNNLAFIYLVTGRPNMALTTYRQNLRLLPKNPEALNGMANCYQAEGNFDKAISYYKKALKIDPGRIQCLYNMALLDNDDKFITSQLEKLYDSSECSSQSRVLVCFALGKVYESKGEKRRAFKYYNEANSLKFSLLSYDEAAYFSYFDKIQSFFSVDRLAQLKNSGCQDTTPIFVFGMPRSGSSLVEQVLASHSVVYGVGEVDDLHHIVDELIPYISSQSFPQVLSTMKPEQFLLLAEYYLKLLREHCSKQKNRIVDKSLNNFFYIGLIKILFPKAKMIHCLRDPMDNCWSLFKHNFIKTHHYCYDQTTLGRYYCRYQELMRHWHHVFPGEIYDVHYEQLISQPEQEIRRLLEYCQLPWEDDCLTFYRTKRIVTTASMRQVRRPIYNSSLKSWELLAEELTPLRNALQPCYAELPQLSEAVL